MILTSSGALGQPLGQASDVTVLKNWWSKYQNSEVGNNAWNSLLTLPFLFSLYTSFPYSVVPLFHCHFSFWNLWKININLLRNWLLLLVHKWENSSDKNIICTSQNDDDWSGRLKKKKWTGYRVTHLLSFFENTGWPQLGFLLLQSFNNYSIIILYSMMLSSDKINLLAR